MKLYKANKQDVEVLKRTEEEGVIIVRINGKQTRLMLKFQPLFDIKGNQVNNFIQLPIEMSSPFGESNGPKMKESKTAKLLADLNDNKVFNLLTKKWEG